MRSQLYGTLQGSRGNTPNRLLTACGERTVVVRAVNWQVGIETTLRCLDNGRHVFEVTAVPWHQAPARMEPVALLRSDSWALFDVINGEPPPGFPDEGWVLRQEKLTSS